MPPKGTKKPQPKETHQDPNDSGATDVSTHRDELIAKINESRFYINRIQTEMKHLENELKYAKKEDKDKIKEKLRDLYGQLKEHENNLERDTQETIEERRKETEKNEEQLKLLKEERDDIWEKINKGDKLFYAYQGNTEQTEHILNTYNIRIDPNATLTRKRNIIAEYVKMKRIPSTWVIQGDIIRAVKPDKDYEPADPYEKEAEALNELTGVEVGMSGTGLDKYGLVPIKKRDFLQHKRKTLDEYKKELYEIEHDTGLDRKAKTTKKDTKKAEYLKKYFDYEKDLKTDVLNKKMKQIEAKFKKQKEGLGKVNADRSHRINVLQAAIANPKSTDNQRMTAIKLHREEIEAQNRYADELKALEDERRTKEMELGEMYKRHQTTGEEFDIEDKILNMKDYTKLSDKDLIIELNKLSSAQQLLEAQKMPNCGEKLKKIFGGMAETLDGSYLDNINSSLEELKRVKPTEREPEREISHVESVLNRLSSTFNTEQQLKTAWDILDYDTRANNIKRWEDVKQPESIFGW